MNRIVDALVDQQGRAAALAPVVLVGTRAYPLMLSGLSAGLTAFGIKSTCSAIPIVAFTGWMGAIFFGGGALISIWSVVQPPQIHLDDLGFTLMDGRLGHPKRRYQWRDVQGFFPWTVRGTVFVAFNIEPSVRKHAAPPRLNRIAGVDDVLSKGWAMRSEALVDYLNSYRMRALAAQEATAENARPA